MTRSRPAHASFAALLLTISLTACSSSTSGPAVDSKQLQQRLDQFVTLVTKPDAGSDLVATAEGASKVETQSDGTVVGSLPRITFKREDGGTATLDPVTLRFSKAGDGLINVEAALPSTMQLKDKAGKVEGEVKIGSQTLKGVWVDKLQTLDKLDMRLGNISVTSPSEEGSAKIDQIAMTGGMTPKGSGLYDGNYTFTMSGLAFDDPKEHTTMKIASLTGNGTMTGARMEDWAKAAKEAGYTLSNPDIFKAWTGGTLDPKMVAFMKQMPDFMGSVDYTYSLNGIEATKGGAREFALKNASFGGGSSPDGAGTTKIKMSFSMGGMQGSADEPMLPPEADVQDASMEVEASGVPGRKLWDIYMDALPQLQAEAKKAAEDASKSGDAASAGSAALEQMGSDISGRALEVLSASKLSIVLSKLNLITPTAKMTGKGLATYLPAENVAPEGKIMLRFTGVDALAKAMEKRGAKDETAQQIVDMLNRVRMMGKVDPASPIGDRAYLIDLQITKEGSVLLNGRPMFGQ